MLIKGMSQKNDSWYWVDYDVLSDHGELLFSLPRADWADWDGDGDLVFARAGKLFRLKKKDCSRFQSKGDEVLKEIADLTALKFEPKEAPEKATSW